MTAPDRPLRVALVTGGSTPEREVALSGAGEVLRALRATGHEVSVVDTVEGALGPEEEGRLLALRVGRAPPDESGLARLREREDAAGLCRRPAVRDAEVVFLVLHGLDGEGGRIQAVLELGRKPYTGSGVLASALAMEKASAKRVLRGAGIPTPAFSFFEGSVSEGETAPLPEARRKEIAALGFPVVVKPSRVGSSVGLTLANDLDEVDAGIAAARRHDPRVLVERMLPGREFTVGVLDPLSGGAPEALGIGEIITKTRLFDYHSKYTPGIAEEVFPARIPKPLAETLSELAVATHRALGLRHFSRVDFRLDENGEPSVLEANTLPGMTTRSLLPQSAAVAGIGFPELCDRIARLAMREGERT